jgi:hypothetical protein
VVPDQHERAGRDEKNDFEIDADGGRRQDRREIRDQIKEPFHDHITQLMPSAVNGLIGPGRK